jgi:hypothetical protein
MQTQHVIRLARGELPDVAGRPAHILSAAPTKVALRQLMNNFIVHMGIMFPNHYVLQRLLDDEEGEALATIIAYHGAVNSPIMNILPRCIVEYLLTGILPVAERWKEEDIDRKEAVHIHTDITQICGEILPQILPVNVIIEVLEIARLDACLPADAITLTIPATMP